jgi:3',5'-cyclic AMP phosphodiesterase CpdA
MMTRRNFLAATAALPVFIRAAEPKPVLHLGLVADPQYADIPAYASRYYRESIGKLTTAVDHFNGLDLDFCVNVGDAIDQQWKSFDDILKVLGKCRHNFHHLLGNHDFELPDAFKAQAPSRLGMERRYYSVTKGEFCFAMLDTNDVSLYAYPINSKEVADAFERLKFYAAKGLLHAQSWNGEVGDTQMKWLAETCKKAADAKQKVIIFAHHPVYPFPCNHNEWNSDELLKFVSRTPNVVAWINGHNHAGGFALRDGVPFITLHGMVETPDTNAFATAKLYSDRIVISGTGREPSREIRFRTA